MVTVFTDFFTSFVLGILTPLTAVCVLPLYPGFLTFLSSRLSGRGENKKAYALFGLLVVAGLIVFVFLLGIIFTTFLQKSLTSVINIISPIALGILGIISIFMIFNYDFAKFLPRPKSSVKGNPYKSAFVFGFLFGPIVIPCNPAFIAAMFTKTVAGGAAFAINMGNFLLFGFGMGFPLVVFSLVSYKKSTTIISFLTKHKRIINLFAGIAMLIISLYYLIFVFRIFG